MAQNIYHFINGGAGYYHTLDLFLLFLTNNLVDVVCILTALWVVVWYPFRLSDMRARLHALHQSVEFVFTMLGTWGMVHIIKLITAVPRPFVALASINILSPYEEGYSFPSAHAAITVALATAVFVHHRRLGILLYGFAAIVCVSRIYVGVHYPEDVVVGALLGFAIASLMHIAWCKISPHTAPQSLVADQAKTG